MDCNALKSIFTMKRILFFLTLAFLPILAGAQTLADTTRFKAFDRSKDFVYTGLQLKSFVRPYAVYVASITQSGTDAPVVTVYENTTGATLTWSRWGAGQYRATSTDLFLNEGKVMFPTARFFMGGEDSDVGLVTNWHRLDKDTIQVRVADTKLGIYTQTDWNNTESGYMIEIRFYP